MEEDDFFSPELSEPLSPNDEEHYMNSEATTFGPASPDEESSRRLSFSNHEFFIMKQLSLTSEAMDSVIPEPMEGYGLSFFKANREYKIYDVNARSREHEYITASMPIFPLACFSNYASVLFEQCFHEDKGYHIIINYLFKQFALAENKENEQFFFKIFEKFAILDDTLFFPDLHTLLTVFINLGFSGLDIHITNRFEDISSQLKTDKRKVSSRKSLTMNVVPNKLCSILQLLTFLSNNKFQHQNKLQGSDILIYLFVVSLDKTVLEHKSLQIQFIICFQAFLKNLPFNSYMELFSHVLRQLFHIVKVHPDRVLHLFTVFPNIERAWQIKRAVAFACLQLLLKKEVTFEHEPTDEKLYFLVSTSAKYLFRSDALNLLLTLLETLLIFPSPEDINQNVRRDIEQSLTSLFNKQTETKKHLFRINTLVSRLNPTLNASSKFYGNCQTSPSSYES